MLYVLGIQNKMDYVNIVGIQIKMDYVVCLRSTKQDKQCICFRNTKQNGLCFCCRNTRQIKYPMFSTHLLQFMFYNIIAIISLSSHLHMGSCLDLYT